MALLPAVHAADGLFDRVHRSAPARCARPHESGYPLFTALDHRAVVLLLPDGADAALPQAQPRNTALGSRLLAPQTGRATLGLVELVFSALLGCSHGTAFASWAGGTGRCAEPMAGHVSSHE